MTKAITGAAAMQLVEKGKLALDAPASEILPELGTKQVLTGFDAAGKPDIPQARAADHLAPPADAHVGAGLRHLECRRHEVPPGHRHSRRRLVPERGADYAAAGRSGRALGVRHFDRLGGQAGRGGGQAAARSLPDGKDLHAARHERHRFRHRARAAVAQGRHAQARREGHHGDRPRDPADARVPHGRRRPLFDGARLPEVHHGAAEGRRADPDTRDRRWRCSGTR